MSVLVKLPNKTEVYSKVTKVTHNYKRQTLLLEFKGLFKKRWILFNGVSSNDWFIK